MHGIVNQAIKELVIEKFGKETWEKVKAKSKTNIEEFLSNEPYDDKITYDLAIATSEVLNITLNEVLVAFGEFWVLSTGLKKYGSLMKSGGSNLKEFLKHLPNFHSRVMLIFPNLAPPEFQISDEKENSINIHYYSTRDGLTHFMFGLLQGLSKFYNTNTSITIVEEKLNGADHDVFTITW